MNARAFLIRGLLAGLLAGIAAFCVAHQVGEPHLEDAIAIEEGATAHDAAEPTHADAHAHSHDHDSAEATVSRTNQRTWGLLTGTVTVGLALGGVVALVAAGVAGRMGRLDLRQSTAVVSMIGFVAFVLVPFLKYPANPPAVGSAATIGERTGGYFGFVFVSLIVAVAITVLVVRLAPRFGGYATVVAGACGYVAAMTVAGVVFPAVDEVGDFPADTLWFFRLAALLTLVTMWAVIGVTLTGLLGRLQVRSEADRQRRALAAAM